jgi:hypothetical protein
MTSAHPGRPARAIPWSWPGPGPAAHSPRTRSTRIHRDGTTDPPVRIRRTQHPRGCRRIARTASGAPLSDVVCADSSHASWLIDPLKFTLDESILPAPCGELDPIFPVTPRALRDVVVRSWCCCACTTGCETTIFLHQRTHCCASPLGQIASPDLCGKVPSSSPARDLPLADPVVRRVARRDRPPCRGDEHFEVTASCDPPSRGFARVPSASAHPGLCPALLGKPRQHCAKRC